MTAATPSLPTDAIAHFMTPSVHTVGHDRSVHEAFELMRKHRIHHLPVLHGGQLVGLVSHRDLTLMEGLEDVDLHTLEVAEAMSTEVFSVTEDVPVGQVSQRMADSRFGSAVIQRGNAIVGIFTTTDALRALNLLLTHPAIARELPAALRRTP